MKGYLIESAKAAQLQNQQDTSISPFDAEQCIPAGFILSLVSASTVSTTTSVAAFSVVATSDLSLLSAAKATLKERNIANKTDINIFIIQ